MYRKLYLILLLAILLMMVLSTVVFAAGGKEDLVKKTGDFGKWLKNDLFSTIGLLGFLIAGGLVIFGNTNGLKQIGYVLAVLSLVAAYDLIWDTLKGFFGSN